MQIGWFDAFRENGEPTWFGESRSRVSLDLTITAIILIYATIVFVYLIILPGVRKRKLISTLAFLLTITVGGVLSVSICHPGWHQGRVRILSSYKAFSPDKLNAILGVQIGLRHVNISLSQPLARDLMENESLTGNEFLMNERFQFDEVLTLEKELLFATQKGLPYPILKVVEYLSASGGGFAWGREYRLSGYYSEFCLYVALALTLIQGVFMCLVPHHTFFISTLVGLTTLSADLIYAWNTPKSIVIRFEGPNKTVSNLMFYLSTCFYSTLLAGTGSLIFGIIGWVMQTYYGYEFRTFFTAKLDDYCGRVGEARSVRQRVWFCKRHFNNQKDQINNSKVRACSGSENTNSTTSTRTCSYKEPSNNVHSRKNASNNINSPPINHALVDCNVVNEDQHSFNFSNKQQPNGHIIEVSLEGIFPECLTRVHIPDEIDLPQIPTSASSIGNWRKSSLWTLS